MRFLRLSHALLTTLLLVGIGVFVVFVVSGLVEVRWRPRDSSERNMPRQPLDEPKRAPELFGTIEEARHPERSAPQFLVRCRQPDAGMVESDQNAWQRQHNPLMWVLVWEQTPVRHRDGRVGKLVVGQTVSVWCTGGMLTTNPPQWGAEFVVIER